MPTTLCSIHERISQCNADEWDEIVRDCRAGIFMSHAFVAAVEEAFLDQARFAHAIVYHDQRAVACGSFCAFPIRSMLAGSLTSLRELGLALALGVLLDTFLVRPILVPAFVIVIDRAQRRRSERALHASTCGGRSAVAIFAPGGERAAKESFGHHAHLNAIVREANDIASQALIVNDLVPEAAGGRP
jgi:hypothetical protein